VRARHRFVYPAFEETTARAIEACEAAWDFFGGVFKVIIPDNTKAIIVHADPLAPRITPAFFEYAQARHFHIDPAPRRRIRGVLPMALKITKDGKPAAPALLGVRSPAKTVLDPVDNMLDNMTTSGWPKSP
jgi:hypothetical protein